ncbi:hypothetical protein C1S82_18725 [Mycolicibacterium cosmeticum]|nr:hypothetical protein C1S82_18725 [Mycolicibacterium cosmeticum]
MLPFQAQGAAMAIEDAWVLADQLGRHAHPREALTTTPGSGCPGPARSKPRAVTTQVDSTMATACTTGRCNWRPHYVPSFSPSDSTGSTEKTSPDEARPIA